MGDPLVTVFVTVYNGEKYIRECLESMINQTYENLEIIIIDDGSMDGTARIISGYNDKRIVLIKNKQNMGIPYNRIKGVELAKGKYLAIMDADDISMPNRIAEQVTFMENNKDVMAAGSFYKTFGKRLNNRVYKLKLSSEEIKITMIFEDPILNPSAIIRLEVMKTFGINYNPNYFVAQDYGLWAQLSKNNKIAIMPQVLLKYRFGHNNVTKLTKKNKAARRKVILDEIHNDLLDYYQFKLTDQEKAIFNLFFAEADPPLNETLVNQANVLFKKMCINNRMLNPLLFRQILEKEIENSIKKSSIGILRKFYYWHQLSNSKPIYIFFSSVYYSIRGFAKEKINKA